jgi:hypothetical protein
MSIPYNPNLPNPPDDPAVDVAGMQTNAGSIATALAVDHVPFNTSGTGQHAQVTFNASNVPGGFSLPVLFTNTKDGAGNNLPGSLPQLFLYANSAAASQNQYLSAASGSALLFGGVIIKWGTISMMSASTLVTYANAFPNNFFAVTLTTLTTTPAVNGVLGYNPTAGGQGGFTAYQLTGNPITVSYIAIGN